MSAEELLLTFDERLVQQIDKDIEKIEQKKQWFASQVQLKTS